MVKTQRIHAQKFHHWQSEICGSGNKAQPHHGNDFEHFVQQTQISLDNLYSRLLQELTDYKNKRTNFANIH